MCINLFHMNMHPYVCIQIRICGHASIQAHTCSTLEICSAGFWRCSHRSPSVAPFVFEGACVFILSVNIHSHHVLVSYFGTCMISIYTHTRTHPHMQVYTYTHMHVFKILSICVYMGDYH